MRDDVCDAFEFAVGTRPLIDEQRGFAEGNRAQVLHRTGGKIRNGEEVEFVARVGNAVVGLKELQRGGGNVLPEAGEVRFARHGPEPQRGLSDESGSRRFDPADDERNQIRGHPDRVRESHHLLVSFDGFRGDGAVGDGGQRLVDHECGGKDGLEIRFIPTGKGAARVRRFELRGRHCPAGPGLILIGAAIESAEGVVERPLKREMQPPLAGSHRLRNRQSAPLKRFVRFDRCLLPAALRVFEDRVADGQLNGVQDDDGRGLRDR